MAARKPRKTDHGITDFDALLNAIKEIKIHHKSRKSTAQAYNIDMRSLGRYLQKFDAEVPEISAISDEELLKVVRRIGSYAKPKLVFNDEQETALAEYVVRCTIHYYGLSIFELKLLAYEFARKIGIKYPESWDRHQTAGWQWYYGFMMRQKHLSLRTPEQTSLNRVKAFCQENVDHFFRNLDTAYAAHPYPPSAIWHMDETGFSIVPSSTGKIISLRGVKRVGQITSAERGSVVTLAFCVNAAGTSSIPPFYLFPRTKMNPYFLTHASKETVGYANKSGWMEQNEFVKWMEHFIKHSHASITSPNLLLLDNHGSHLSVAAIDMAIANGTTMLTFPPHCSHRLQPLDVSVYGPVKGEYARLHNAWLKENAGKALDIAHIPLLAGKALMRGATPENIVSGFTNTGICPYDPGKFQPSEFVALGVAEGNTESSAVENTYEPEEQRRIVMVSDHIEVSVQETVSTIKLSEPSTSGLSHGTSLNSIVSSVGPLQEATPQKKSNRGPKPQKTSILTSPENVAVLKDR